MEIEILKDMNVFGCQISIARNSNEIVTVKKMSTIVCELFNALDRNNLNKCKITTHPIFCKEYGKTEDEFMEEVIRLNR